MIAWLAVRRHCVATLALTAGLVTAWLLEWLS